MSTTNKRAQELKAKVNNQFGQTFKKTKKKKQRNAQKRKEELRVDIPEQHFEGEDLDSPPCDDSEHLSKQEGSSSEDKNESSESVELPRDDVPEILSDDQEELDT